MQFTNDSLVSKVDLRNSILSFLITQSYVYFLNLHLFVHNGSCDKTLLRETHEQHCSFPHYFVLTKIDTSTLIKSLRS